ncbi:MAG TPA: hypothetical protein VIK72_02135 [Clostridiaceae bacterium]
MKRIIVILLFTLTNLVELLILGYLFIIYSAYLNRFSWHETDPIMLIIVWPLIIVFLSIGGILYLFRMKFHALKLNTTIPFYTIAYLGVTLCLITTFRNFCIISSCLVIAISFLLVMITTIISLKKMITANLGAL